MIQTLKQFTGGTPLFDATSAFLGKLGIKHSGYATKESLPLTDYFDQMPQYLQDANATIDKLYDLGCVNDSSLGGTSPIESPKYVSMNIFAFEAKPQARITRTIVSSLTRAFNRIADDPVILIIRQGNYVTLSTIDREKGAKAEILGKVTILRNIDCTSPHPGHIQILDRIAKEVNGCSDFDSLYKKWLYSFSLKLLSDDFFNGYKAIYEDIIALTTGKRMKKADGKWKETIDTEIPQEEKDIYGKKVMASFAQFEDPEKAVRDYVKKLMGRLVFIQFLQKKGWMGVPAERSWGEGDRDFIQNVFKQSANKDNFVDEVLEPLFRDINTDRAGYLVTSPKVNFGQQIKVPYLNGGLFEEDAYDRADFTIPAKYFWNENATLGTKDKDLGLLQFFAKYNFTIDENAPDDVEVGVDPEMLGRIFENLLEDNKDKGAFYTPKEIVQYMCRESLIAYLTTYSVEHGNTNPYDKVESAIRKLVISPADIVPQMREQKPQALQEFGDALRNVKICDPAIGSGAFPMGLLNELVRCREAIGAWAKDEDGNLLVGNRAALKCEIVCNNIYGVDIERGAIDIARLRFWLSIVVDEKTPQTLPNLDYKFMQGNSLITTFDGEYVNLDTKTQQHSKVAEMRLVKQELHKLKLEYYSSTGDHKHKLDIKIKDAILRLISLQLGYEVWKWYNENVNQQMNLFPEMEQPRQLTFADIKQELPEETKRICELGAELRKQLKDESKSLTERSQVDIRFFDWRMMFTEVFEGENPGFDIVIGNPPYIQLQANEGLLSSIYCDKGFETFDSTGDIFSLFYEQGWRLLRKKGCLCYITSNKWMRNNSGENTRRFFAERTNPMLLINFEDIQLFDNATVETNILLYTNDDNQKKTLAVVTDTKGNDILISISDYVASHSVCMSFTTTDSWVVLSKEESALMDKIQRNSTLLQNWKVDINFGIKTGYNTAFLIDGETRSYILDQCANDEEREATEEIIKPVLRGRDIKRYQAHWADCWLINTHNGIPNKLSPIDIEDYPALKAYLMTHWERINRRSDKGRTPFNLRNCAYVLDFSKPKIVWGEISDRSKFCYDEEGLYFCEATTFFMTGNISSFLLCYLNSKLAEYLFSKIATTTGMGTVRWKKYKIEQLLVPHTSTEFEQNIDSLYRKYLSYRDQFYLDKIDHLIYQLYGLTNGEVKIIDPNETTVGSDDDLFIV